MVESLQSIKMTCIKDYRSLPMFFGTAKGNTFWKIEAVFLCS